MLSQMKKESYLGQSKNTHMDASEEFAKLDALLADLLMEVEQPIMLNKPSAMSNNDQNDNKNFKNINRCEILKNLDDIERSVDYLNEQKEKLKAKKSSYQKAGNNDIIFEEDIDHEPIIDESFRTIRSKFDYYITNSNNQSTDQLNKYCFSKNIPSRSQNDKLILPNPTPLHVDESLQYIPNTQKNKSNQFIHLMHSNMSTKNEIDDDCSSVKSGYSTASAVQRSKYHTISNNYVESTGPRILGQVRHTQNKRAFSAPPVDSGKILLQRIELKSPLTIKNPSTASFQQLQQDQDSASAIDSFSNNKAPLNRYNNRNVLKTNTLQPQPQRGIRAFSERPTNTGYDTDTGLLGYNQRATFNRQRQMQALRNDIEFDSESENFKISPTRNLFNSYNTLRRQDGYDTDTGLINARKSLNQRLLSPKYEYTVRESSSNSGLIEPVFNSKRLNSSVNIKPVMISENNLPLKIDREFDSSNLLSSKLQTMECNSNRKNSVGYSGNENNDSINKSAFHSITKRNKSDSLKKETLSNFDRLDFDDPTNQSTLLVAVNDNLFAKRATNEEKKAGSHNNDGDDAKPWKFVQDIQDVWYKPKITREDAINTLKNKQPGSFLIRDSNNFPGAYGLALKVDKLPPNILYTLKPNSDQSIELVRHFLIEPTSGGVRIKGCCNEPVFENLAALVYQHLMTPLALPLKLVLSTASIQSNKNQISGSQKIDQNGTNRDSQNSSILLEKGAACHVFYLNSTNVGQVTGTDAINKAIESLSSMNIKDNSQLVHSQFKVNSQGIFVTDINRKKFLRNHFPTQTVAFCALDETRVWPFKIGKIQHPRIFGIVIRPLTSDLNHQCHLFVELDVEQPAIAIVDFINRYLIPSKSQISQSN